MVDQYEAATAQAASFREALARAGGTATDELLELEVAPDGGLQRCVFSDQAMRSSAARLSTSFMTLYRAAVKESNDAVAVGFDDLAGVGDAIREMAPETDDDDRPTVGPAGGRAAPDPSQPAAGSDDDETDEPTPFPSDPDLAHWDALFDAHDDPIAGLNAIAADPAFRATRPGGDPQRWQQDLTDGLTAMIERGQRLMPELQAITATADNRVAEVTVTPTGGIQSLRFHSAVTSMTPTEAAGELRALLATARRDAAAAADELLAREGVATDIRPWGAPNEL